MGGERRSAGALLCPGARAFQRHVATSLTNAGGSPRVAAGMLHALAASGSCKSSTASTGLLPGQKNSWFFTFCCMKNQQLHEAVVFELSLRHGCFKQNPRKMPSWELHCSGFILFVRTGSNTMSFGGSPDFRSASLPSQAACPALLCLGSEVPGGWEEEPTQSSELRSGGSGAPHVLGHSSGAWAAQSLGCLQGHKAPWHGVVLQVWQRSALASASVTGSAFACFLHFEIILVYVSAGP